MDGGRDKGEDTRGGRTPLGEDAGFRVGDTALRGGVVFVAGDELESDEGLWRSGNDFRGWRPLDKGVFFVGEP